MTKKLAKDLFNLIPCLSDNDKIDVEQLITPSKFDVAVSFFGLHWINDIDACAKDISKLLKPAGTLMFVVPLEKMHLFTIRQ